MQMSRPVGTQVLSISFKIFFFLFFLIPLLSFLYVCVFLSTDGWMLNLNCDRVMLAVMFDLKWVIEESSVRKYQ